MATELPHPSVVLAKEMQEKAKSCGFAALFADGDRPGGATAAKLMAPRRPIPEDCFPLASRLTN